MLLAKNKLESHLIIMQHSFLSLHLDSGCEQVKDDISSCKEDNKEEDNYENMIKLKQLVQSNF